MKTRASSKLQCAGRRHQPLKGFGFLASVAKIRILAIPLKDNNVESPSVETFVAHLDNVYPCLRGI